jgi:hypothetical protein
MGVLLHQRKYIKACEKKTPALARRRRHRIKA